MSSVEDRMYAANAARKEENRLAELDHRIEMAKIRLAQDMPKNPYVEEFKARRTWNTKQIRRWKPSTEQITPKKRGTM
jgi:hypothetical protein